MNLGAVFFVGYLTCSFHMLHTWPTQFYVGPPTSTFLATLVLLTVLKLTMMNKYCNKCIPHAPYLSVTE